ncbi:MAG TPA: FmdB family zinc ribbon protein [Candidatus Limnocylindrales bacterium]|nr:FmdB family zinc ribbon protein [Candidatus Limnocylindrales bacterium]
MPTYEYICQDCKEITDVRATMEEKGKGLNVSCSSCGSNNMTQFFGNATVTAAFPLH